MINRKLLFLYTILALLVFKNAYAQNTNAVKFGALNVYRAIVECAEGKQANDDYQKKFEAKRDELGKKQKEIQDLQQQLQAQSNSLNDATRMALNRSIETKTTELKRSQEDAEKEFGDLRNEIFNRIGTKLVPVVQQYAKEYSFTLILDTSNQASQVVYSDPSIEITDDVIKRLDASQISSKAPVPVAPKEAAAPSPSKDSALPTNKAN